MCVSFPVVVYDLPHLRHLERNVGLVLSYLRYAEVQCVSVVLCEVFSVSEEVNKPANSNQPYVPAVCH